MNAVRAESIPVGGKRKFIARRLKCEKLARCPDTLAHADEVSTHADTHTHTQRHSHTQPACLAVVLKQSVTCKATLITFSVIADAAGLLCLAVGLGGVCAIFDLHSICNNFRLMKLPTAARTHSLAHAFAV